MRHSLATLLAAAVAVHLPPTVASAQGRGGAGSFGGGTAGAGASFGGSSAGATSFGGGGFGASPFGSGSAGAGRTTLGQSSFGNSGAGGGGFGGAANNAPGQTGARAFVGRSAADLEAFFGSAARTQQPNSRGERSGRRGGDNSSSGEVRRPEVLVALSPAAELSEAALVRRAPAGVALAGVEARLESIGMGGVRAVEDGGVLVLSGVVPTPAQRLLAEKLFAIEPGVRRIDNRLVVAATAEEIPPVER